eukprot:12625621-Ditylum_brightwellii.AAC.1
MTYTTELNHPSGLQRHVESDRVQTTLAQYLFGVTTGDNACKSNVIPDDISNAKLVGIGHIVDKPIN